MADWKDTMFFWCGEMTTGDHGYGDPTKPNEMWGFKGTWSGVEAAEPPQDGQDLRPSEDAFAADAANKFHVAGGVGTKQQMMSPYPPDENDDDPYRHPIEGETWQLFDGYPAWYLLDNGEGHEKYSDDKHVLRTWFVSRLPPLQPPKNPYGDDFKIPDYSDTDIVVVGKGSNEFAKFIALGIWPKNGSGGPMVLARRYLDDRDPRNKMSHQQILATVPEDLLAAGKPWNADIMATKWSKSKGKGKKKKVTETDNSSSNVAADMTAGDAGHDAKRQKTKG